MTTAELQQLPLFVSAEIAAEIAGLADEQMREFLESNDPIPHLKCGAKGKKKLIYRPGIEPYLRRQCVGSIEDPNAGTNKLPRIN